MPPNVRAQTGNTFLQPSVVSAYQTYFKTGYYEKRYPTYNQRVFHILKDILAMMKKPLRIVDYGCGNGRYLLPVLQTVSCTATAFDICKNALDLLGRRLEHCNLTKRVKIIHNNTEILSAHHGPDNKVALVMVMFGVLSHIPEEDGRQRVLSLLSDLLDPEEGRLVLSVPNRYRRFWRLQQKNKGCDIFYDRSSGGQNMRLFYHLYSPRSLKKALLTAGLVPELVCAESLFPESWVTRNRWIGFFDWLMSLLLPAAMGYGILVVARKARTEKI